MGPGSGIFVGLISVLLLIVAVTVAILRWALRINDIVKRLDIIAGLLRKDPPSAPDLRHIGTV